MAARLLEAGTSNAISTTLNGSVGDSDNTITLTSSAGLVAPGVICIDRVDLNNTQTPTLREYVSFTGISTNTLTGCVRGLAGSSGQAHASGAIVEELFSVTHWGDLVDFLQASHNSAGEIVVSSVATIANARIHTHLNASGASITGDFPLNPMWIMQATASTPTAGLGKSLYTPSGGSWKWFSVTLSRAASGATVLIDINRNGSSIFDAGTRLMIPGGGTYASTASISTKVFSMGNRFTVDIDAIGGIDLDPVVQGRA